MNEIIFLMWLADIAYSVSALCLIFLLAFLIYAVCLTVGEMEFPRNKPLYTSVICCVVLLAVMPSRATMYSMIAVKAGQQMADSKLGDKALKALDLAINKAISKLEQTK